MDLTRKRERDRLSVRREPYWHRLNKGAALGFRRGPDTWVLRYTDRASGKTKYAALEDDNLDFDQAKEKAETELGHRTKSAVRVVKRQTVKAALETYLEDLRRHDRGAAAEDAEWRFKKYVYGDVLAELPLERVTRDDFEEWRERQRPGRESRTVNRQVRSVKAALNRALELGHLGNPLTWKVEPLSDDAEDTNDTAVFLTPAQRKALIAAADPSAGHFLRGMELSGARPHELAAALVSDFDGAALRLAHRKGRPPKPRVRYVTLGSDGVEFFAKMADGKSRDSHLFKPDRLEKDQAWDADEGKDDDRMWTGHLWARRVRAAIEKHNNDTEKEVDKIPESASAYSFRHTRISELLQVHNIDPITIAQQTGTSVAMIEKTYFKFIATTMRAKLSAIKEDAR
jgi:integrase